MGKLTTVTRDVFTKTRLLMDNNVPRETILDVLQISPSTYARIKNVNNFEDYKMFVAKIVHKPKPETPEDVLEEAKQAEIGAGIAEINAQYQLQRIANALERMVEAWEYRDVPTIEVDMPTKKGHKLW